MNDEKQQKHKATTLARVSNTIQANRIYAYRAGIGPIKPTKYQSILHSGGVGPEGKGCVNLGRTARERWAFMPNQVGKSMCGAADDVLQAYGIHPSIAVPVPNIGVVLTISHLKSIQVMRRLIWDFIPLADQDAITSKRNGCGFFNRNMEKPARIVLPNGSEIHFMSYDQDAMEFESLTIHWAHCDEEPPQSIYNQLQIRLLRNRGHLFCTMTPWVEEGIGGISWTADAILGNADLPEDERSEEIWIAPRITMHDAPWLDSDAIEEWKKKCKSPEEYKARFEGIHMQRSGSIFEHFRDFMFNQQNPVERGHLLPHDFPLHPSWQKMIFIDASSPSGTTAALWIAITTPGWWQGIQFKANEIVCYREYKEKDFTVGQHCANILARNGADLLTMKYMDGRFMNQSADADSGKSYGALYRDHGISCVPWGAALIQAEIDSSKEYFEATLDRTNPHPGMFVLESCRMLRREIKLYVYPMHKTGDLKGERKYVQHKKQKGIALVDCMKAAAHQSPKTFDAHYQDEIDMSQYQNPVTGT